MPRHLPPVNRAPFTINYKYQYPNDLEQTEVFERNDAKENMKQIKTEYNSDYSSDTETESEEEK